MKAIATVIGKDRVGIIADVSALLAQRGVNVAGHQPDGAAGLFPR